MGDIIDLTGLVYTYTLLLLVIQNNRILCYPDLTTRVPTKIMIMILWIFLLFISSSSQVKALKLFGRKKLQCNLEVQNFLIPGLHDPVSGKCLNANCPYGAVASHPNGGKGNLYAVVEDS